MAVFADTENRGSKGSLNIWHHAFMRGVVTAVLLTVMSACGANGTTKERVQTEKLVWTTPDSVYAGAPGHAAARLGRATAGRVLSSLSISRDGGTIGWLDQSTKDKTDRRLVMLNRASGQRTTWKLRSLIGSADFALAPQTGAMVLVTEDYRMVVYSGGTRSPRTVRLAIPPYREPEFNTERGPAFAMSVPVGVLLTRASEGASGYGGPSEVFVADLHGGVRRLFTDGEPQEEGVVSNWPIQNAAVDPSGEHLAYVTGARAGHCDNDEFVLIRNLATGRLEESPGIPALPEDVSPSIDSLFWGADGRLVMVLGGTPVLGGRYDLGPNNSKCDVPLAPTAYELRGDQWATLDVHGSAVLPGPRGVLAVQKASGALELVDPDGQTKLLADHVREVRWTR